MTFAMGQTLLGASSFSTWWKHSFPTPGAKDATHQKVTLVLIFFSTTAKVPEPCMGDHGLQAAQAWSALRACTLSRGPSAWNQAWVAMRFDMLSRMALQVHCFGRGVLSGSALHGPTGTVVDSTSGLRSLHVSRNTLCASSPDGSLPLCYARARIARAVGAEGSPCYCFRVCVVCCLARAQEPWRSAERGYAACCGAKSDAELLRGAGIPLSARQGQGQYGTRGGDPTP